jgi:hypothetical protein
VSFHRVPNLEHEKWTTVNLGWLPDYESYFIELCQTGNEAVVVGHVPREIPSINSLIVLLNALNIEVEQKLLTDLYVDQSVNR